MYSVFLLTGSNLGNREEQLAKAIRELEEHIGFIEQTSSVFETEAWGNEDLPAHLNQAVLIKTLLPPLDLLKSIHAIEAKLGRVRQDKWGVRAIDIDIIYFEDKIIRLPELIVPHPLMQERNFVLAPLSEIAPDMLHPVFLVSNKQLLKQSKDKLKATPVTGK
ncbi:2-amino-4-hydroxy-6-hydroxymethyldihydropteridine diphosphokinase [Taibaiella lutea]|uniref:2-amino-4-hydroxy-6-hydroxymethyldihydropteridine pyrophosphokinase n=1 Tax=Taibaiella lutea TaxID=2608001 RepID=A0A5M6CWS9_9BACT|nr:2-amino-4-hydroxy-6-hydroxymethyldihydropteridine diphosphokinase [Taibaiella lutea]KAA5537355.1 2-amino-4-hydroxy-6-hydroxymethyldihydropteridine diphosphokinase [Taibaiella lutea]